jgi:hypothetical protein
MSLRELFDNFKYDQAACVSVQRRGANYWFTFGDTLSTSFECDSPEEGIQQAIELSRTIRVAEDEVERRATLVREFARQCGLGITCTIVKRILCGENKDRLICTADICLGSEPVRRVEPICGWSDEEIEINAVSQLYYEMRKMQLDAMTASLTTTATAPPLPPTNPLLVMAEASSKGTK